MLECDRWRAWIVAMSLFALAPCRASAQLALGGTSSSVAPPAGVAPVRWPAVAYSTSNDVYLAVSGAGHVAGYAFDGGGTALGASFTIGGGAFAQAPRVAWADDAFAVTWHETLPGDAVRVRARFVHAGGALDPDFDVSPLGTNWEMGAAVAWSSASHELLVAWQSTVDTRIYAQRTSRAGTPLGGPITIDPRAIYFRDPAVAYHAATDTFFVAYAGCVGTNDCFVDAQRVQAGTGALVGGPIALDASIHAGYVPEIAYAARTERMLVVWDRLEPGSGGFYGRTIDGAGTPSAAPVLVTSTYGSYDANGLSYDDVSGTFVVVTHGSTQQDVAIELSAGGDPLGAAIPFGPTSVGGNFNPRVVARTGHAEWLAVTSSDFATLTAQRLVTATRDPTVTIDAGAASADAASDPDGAVVARDAATRDDGGRGASDGGRSASDGGARASLAGGCGCALGARARAPGVAVAGLVLVLALVRRRSRTD